MVFTVRHQSFEGPLETLLTLIEKRKLFINDISLAKVTDDYLAHIKGLQNFPIAESANFVLVASTLVLIKSKSLLPSLELTAEEEGDIADLERRLKIYRRIKELSVNVRAIFGKRVSFLPETRPVEPVFSPDRRVSVSSLLSSVKEVLQNLPQNELLPKVVVEKVMSLEEMIVDLTKRVTEGLRMSFKEFSNDKKASKTRIIVSFLAMLELVKQGIISVTQESHGDDILMETKRLGVPKY